MRRLLILTPRELTGDVRARREALAAKAAGLDVTGLCVALAGEADAPLDDVKVVRIPGGRVSTTLRRAGLGGLKPSRPVMRELRGLYRLARLARTTIRLARAGFRLGRFDVVHANDLDALPAAWLIARRSRARLVYDAHELYPLMEPSGPRLYWSVASRLEAVLARRADDVVTNCDPFAEELRERLRLARTPIVVLNCPDFREAPLPDRVAGGPLRAIYQAAGDHPGRPVDDLLEAAEHAAQVEITIRVVDMDRDRVGRTISDRCLEERVRLVPSVPVTELVDALVGFDVGIVLNRPLTPNTELAVPGKVFEYMMAGLAVVAPRLPGLVPIVEGQKIGLTFDPGRPAELGEALARLAGDPDALAAMRRRSLELARTRYNSATQAEMLERIWAVPG